MGVERRLAAVLAADVVGFSRLMGRDEEGAVARVKALLEEVIRPKVAECRGRVVKTTGDGVLAEFGSVFNAFQCALEVQQLCAVRNEGVAPDEQYVLRIGLNIGDIIFDDDDVFGDGVNIAARLESLAKPGAICVSYRAWEDLRKLQLAFTDLGEQKLKNIAQPVRVFSYTPPPADVVNAAAPERVALRGRRLWIATACVAIATLGGTLGATLLMRPRPQPFDFISGQLDQTPCAWLRVANHSSVGGLEVFTLSGAARDAPETISKTLLEAARNRGVDVDEVMTGDIAPLDANRCPLIDRLKAFRYRGPSRFMLTARPRPRGVTRAEIVLDPRELGPYGAVYGIEPSGLVDRIVGRVDLDKLGPPAVVRRADGAYDLNIDIDHVGWNGILFLESQAPIPNGAVEQADRPGADATRFNALAKSGAWHFELAWFRVGEDRVRVVRKIEAGAAP
jgi:class 3 adenylate cyclase